MFVVSSYGFFLALFTPEPLDYVQTHCIQASVYDAVQELRIGSKRSLLTKPAIASLVSTV